MIKAAFSLLLLLQPCLGSSSKSRHLRHRRLTNRGVVEMKNSCILLEKIHRNKDRTQGSSMTCELQGSDIKDNDGVSMVTIDSVTMEWAQENNVISGETTFFVEGAMIDDENTVHYPENAEIVLENRYDNDEDDRRHHRHLARTTGDKSVLAVRVIATDSETTSGETRLSEEIFGTGGYDKVNLVSQYKACSYNKLRFYPAQHPKLNQDGVYTVTIDRSVKSKGEGEVEEIVTAQLREDLGYNLEEQFDHVMLCLPEGTGGGEWVGFAYVNSWKTILNNDWCERMSGQAHEMAHNLNLGHSGEGDGGYNDQSGLMGYSYYSDEGPLMCFNGAKSWQLGWYSDRHEELDPLTQGWRGHLLGVADYNHATGNDRVLLRLVGANNGLDYYLAFNRRAGINAGTMEGQDMVLVTARPTGLDASSSKLVAKLGVGQSWDSNEFDGETVTVTLNDITFSSNGARADVTVTSTALDSPPEQQPIQEENEPPQEDQQQPPQEEDKGPYEEKVELCASFGSNINNCVLNRCKWASRENKCFWD